MLNEKFAVVDLETTGNNRKSDHIIQLSIVIVENMEVVDQYTRFLSDETDFSPFIRELTGISPEMLDGAPKFQDIAGEVHRLLDGCIFTAHNVEFDSGFLESAFSRVGMKFRPVHLLDTVELSKIFLPTLERFQLNEIAQVMGIELSNAHRADEDAKATAELLIHILDKLVHMDTETLKHLYHLSKPLKYSLSDLLFSTIAEAGKSPAGDFEKYGSFLIRREEVRFGEIEPITVPELYSIYIENSHSEHRSDQLRLANQIFESLELNENLALEAYTGIGKTLAFLIASISYHSLYGKRVLVSTSKKILQSQILRDALSDLLVATDLPVTAVSLKGRDNYINLDAFELLLSLEENNTEIVHLKMKLLVWLLETHTGDLSEIHLKGPEKAYYRTASIQSGQKSRHLFFKRALDRAKEGTLTVTNHYFLTDCINYMDDIDTIVIDEAHQLKRALMERTRTTYSYQAMKFFIGQIGTVNQDRLLSSYISHNNEISVYLLEDILRYLNQNIDRIFGAISAGNIDEVQRHIELGINHAATFLGTVRGTANYQALYNHMHHFQTMLSELGNGFRSGRYSLETSDNLQKIKVHIRSEDIGELSGRLSSGATTIMLSGTLEVNGSFRHLDFWYGERPYRTLVLGNEALFGGTRVFIPEDIPLYDIHDENFISAIVEYMAVYLSETGRKLMVLFSNYELLDKVAEYVEEVPTFEDFAILRQSRITSGEKLLSQFNQLDKCLLLGTSSFNEGINIETSGTKCLLLTKLPFPVPNGSDFRSFYKNDLPEAVFQFRQIAGRLRRKPGDEGLLVLFDRRILERKYKDAFLKYFPEENVILGDGESFKALLRDL